MNEHVKWDAWALTISKLKTEAVWHTESEKEQDK
jgi:hypothetical protein